MSLPSVCLLHYTAPPVVGGVEAVLQAHLQLLSQHDYPVRLIAGRGGQMDLARPVEVHQIPEIDTQHPRVLEISRQLETGSLAPEFYRLTDQLAEKLLPLLAATDVLIAHNVFTKHFNLPLTAALARLIDGGAVRGCIAWCHDLTWTSPSSRSKVRPGFPWDLIRTRLAGITYVAVSRQRQSELSRLFDCDPSEIPVVYNGVDPYQILGISNAGQELVQRLDLLDSDLVIIMPVRITQAKNIELALDIAAALQDSGVRLRMLVTGPPDPHDENSLAYYQRLRQRRNELGLGSAFRFVYESGPDPGIGYTITMNQVSELLRCSDFLLMPSRREGFGMPILEAGLARIPVFSTHIPAALELGRDEVSLIEPDGNPEAIAAEILAMAEAEPTHRLRRRVRKELTWQAIFRRQIEPLILDERQGRAIRS